MKTYLSDRFVRYLDMDQFRILKKERYQMITGSPPIAHKDHMISFISYVTYQIDHMVHMSGKFGRNIISNAYKLHESISELRTPKFSDLSVSESVQESEVLTQNFGLWYGLNPRRKFWLKTWVPKSTSKNRVYQNHLESFEIMIVYVRF